MRPVFNYPSSFGFGIAFWFALLGTVVSQPPVLEVRFADHLERGMPILWSGSHVMLLRNDGSISTQLRANVVDHQITKELFQPASAASMQAALESEFGRDYEVRIGGHYLIVARREVASVWDKRFESILRQCKQFFSIRGFAWEEPSFPMVAIVLRNAAEFQRYAARDQATVSDTTLGYYSPSTNRMVLYEQPETRQDWFSTSTTILHEATHQITYNTGLHRRVTDTPLWIVEGLASMFEAPGMMDPRSTANAKAMLNQARWGTWKELRAVDGQLLQTFASLVDRDDLFESRPDDAYAVSWAISLYLSERDARRYQNLLAYTANRKPGELYTAAQRMSDFRHIMGHDLSILIRNVDRYLTDLDSN